MTAQLAIFDGLFVRALGVSGPLKEELRRLGCDLDALKTSYPLETWDACLEAACAHLHPGVPLDEAARELGRRFTRGYLETIVGRMARPLLAFLSPRAFVRRVPDFVGTGLPHATFALAWEGESVGVLTMHHGGAHGAHFLAGIIEAAFPRLKVEPTQVSREVSRLHVTLP